MSTCTDLFHLLSWFLRYKKKLLAFNNIYISLLNPISLLGYLKTSKSHVWCPNITNDNDDNKFSIFFAKLMQFVSLCQRLSKKLNFIKIWQVEVGHNKYLVCYKEKQSFRQCAWGLRQLVLKPSFRPKGRVLGL